MTDNPTRAPHENPVSESAEIRPPPEHALWPCPFCDNHEPKAPISILGRWIVECGVPCGAAVRDYATARDAVMAWNRRAAISLNSDDEAMMKLLIQTGCEASDIHLSCAYPDCSCRQIPAAVRAVLRALREMGR